MRRAWLGQSKGVACGGTVPYLGRGDYDDSQLNVVLLTIQHSLGLGLHGDNVSGPEYLELEVGIAGDDHELHITWPPQDDVVGPGEVDHLKSEHFDAVVAGISECDRQSDPPEGDGLLVWNHSIEWVWDTLELVLGKP
jgi:hypothetical protein